VAAHYLGRRFDPESAVSPSPHDRGERVNHHPRSAAPRCLRPHWQGNLETLRKSSAVLDRVRVFEATCPTTLLKPIALLH